MNELPVPPAARSDKKAQEMIRAWVANSDLHCSLQIGCWGENEPMAWGILLTDVVRHVADAMLKEKGWEKSQTVAQIRKVFNDELDSPTAKPTGAFHTH
jgi:hypothetical protein